MAKGYYAGGTVNGTHWLSSTSWERSWRSAATRGSASKIHRKQKVYSAGLNRARAAVRLRQAERPIDFHCVHNVCAIRRFATPRPFLD